MSIPKRPDWAGIDAMAGGFQQAVEHEHAVAKAAVEALRYAVWQIDGGGTPAHNDWRAVFKNTLNEIEASGWGASDE